MSADPTRNSIATESADRRPLALPANDRFPRAFERRSHLLILGMAVAVVLGSLLVNVNSEGAIYFRGLPNYPLPVVCPLRRCFGMSCPTCGMTRSMVFLVQGRLAESWAMHRLGWLIFGLIVLQIPYRIWCLSTRRSAAYRPRLTELSFAALMLLLVVNWLFS
jgi:Protein of unknown function (DUF2752)